MARAKTAKSVRWTVFETALGWVGIAASPRGLVHVTLPRQRREGVSQEWAVEFGPPAPEGELPSVLRDLKGRLIAYYQGEPVAFADLLDPAMGTPFQRRVWAELRKVPRGQVISYGELARRAGSPRAARAVGQAMARNPCPVVVPCHRVVGSDGNLVGFGGGVEMKARMLAMEGVLLDL